MSEPVRSLSPTDDAIREFKDVIAQAEVVAAERSEAPFIWSSAAKKASNLGFSPRGARRAERRNLQMGTPH